MRIDLNSDVGESFGEWSLGRDEELIPLVSSVNVACGAHAGDPLVMTRTVRLARDAGVAVGAHPGYPDLQGFGRRDMSLSADELSATIRFQLGALAGIARTEGCELRHVKPHGALYNRAATDDALATCVAEAVRGFSPDLILVALAGSALQRAGASAGLTVAAEAFADRAYEHDGTLRSRQLPGALLESPQQAAAQALAIAREGRIRTHDGETITVQAQTICIHGDTPGAPEIARTVRRALEGAGVVIQPVESAG
jgi:5-oxoprolinase (ATP-hydrolysing) subunit A